MPDYSDSITVKAPAQQVFQYVSDLANLPKYLPTVRKTMPQQGERIVIQGNAAGQPYESDGRFRVDSEARTMEWGSDGEHDYHGRMDVTGNGQQSEVKVALHFGSIDQFGPDPDSAIRGGIREALESIRGQVEFG